MADVLADLADLLLPRRCLGCGCPGVGLCRRCARGRDVQRALDGPRVVHAGCEYGGAARAAIVRYKERDRRELGGALAALLAPAVLRAAHGQIVDSLVPIPSSRAAARSRGGDHMARLARRTAASLAREGAISVARPLSLVRSIEDAAGLGLRARRENVRGAFLARPAPARCRVVIVDDVLTTGASMQEAYRALTEQGWTVIGAAVVASTPRRA